MFEVKKINKNEMRENSREKLNGTMAHTSQAGSSKTLHYLGRHAAEKAAHRQPLKALAAEQTALQQPTKRHPPTIPAPRHNRHPNTHPLHPMADSENKKHNNPDPTNPVHLPEP